MQSISIIGSALVMLLMIPSAWGQNTSNFQIPIWNDSAQWEMERLGGSNSLGFLEGPIAEVGSNVLASSATDYSGGLDRGYTNASGGVTFWGWYDSESKRAHRVVGNGTGYLDGPFKSARIAPNGYNFKPNSTKSSDGRYLYFTDNWGGRKMLRRLDFKEQMVTTILPNISSASNPGLTTGDNGKIYMLTATSHLVATSIFKTACRLTVLSDTGSIDTILVLDSLNGKLGGINRLLPIAYDDVNNRLYCGQNCTGWYVYYWDLADGSFHGVVPISDSLRGRNTPGTFEGTNFYGEGAFLTFGPDDPNKRFLYFGAIDTYACFRLDLQNRMVAAAYTVSSSPKTIIGFSNTQSSKIMVYAAFRWVNTGHDFVSASHSPTQNYLFKRIK